MMKKAIYFVTPLIGLLLFAARPTSAQTRSLSQRLNQVESRLDRLVDLQEAFLPTFERMEKQVAWLESRVEQLPNSPSTVEARRDIADLRQRVKSLEGVCARLPPNHNPNESRQAAELRTECELLDIRLRGTNGRLKALHSQHASATEVSLRPAASQRPRMTLVIEVYLDDELVSRGRNVLP